eukprot:2690063-Amphidinium_carterae.1
MASNSAMFLCCLPIRNRQNLRLACQDFELYLPVTFLMKIIGPQACVWPQLVMSLMQASDSNTYWHEPGGAVRGKATTRVQ